jgi:hypothetical protein
MTRWSFRDTALAVQGKPAPGLQIDTPLPLDLHTAHLGCKLPRPHVAGDAIHRVILG